MRKNNHNMAIDQTKFDQRRIKWHSACGAKGIMKNNMAIDSEQTEAQLCFNVLVRG